MADVGDLGDGGVVVGVDEVDMVGGPAHHKYEDNHSEHQHHLAMAPLAKVLPRHTSIVLKS